MKILLLGANGQVGWELQRALLPLGEMMICDRHSVDLEDFDAVRSVIRGFTPNVIVNAAAYTNVDLAETETEKAYRVNAGVVAVLAKEAQNLDAWLLHYSTDYVFDGSKPAAYNENDLPNPKSAYGKSKLAGELAIIESCRKYLIFRTSWVYAARGSNFPKTMLRLAHERDELSVVSDQNGAPTSAELIADITAHSLYKIIQENTSISELSGTYNLSADGETNWYNYAKYVINEAQQKGVKLQLRQEKVRPILTSEYSTPAFRPLNSRLDTSKLSSKFGVILPNWQIQVDRLVSELVIKV